MTKYEACNDEKNRFNYLFGRGLHIFNYVKELEKVITFSYRNFLVLCKDFVGIERVEEPWRLLANLIVVVLLHRESSLFQKAVSSKLTRYSFLGLVISSLFYSSFSSFFSFPFFFSKLIAR